MRGVLVLSDLGMSSKNTADSHCFWLFHYFAMSLFWGLCWLKTIVRRKEAERHKGKVDFFGSKWMNRHLFLSDPRVSAKIWREKTWQRDSCFLLCQAPQAHPQGCWPFYWSCIKLNKNFLIRQKLMTISLIGTGKNPNPTDYNIILVLSFSHH